MNALIFPLASILSLFVPAVVISTLSAADDHIPVLVSFLYEYVGAHTAHATNGIKKDQFVSDWNTVSVILARCVNALSVVHDAHTVEVENTIFPIGHDHVGWLAARIRSAPAIFVPTQFVGEIVIDVGVAEVSPRPIYIRVGAETVPPITIVFDVFATAHAHNAIVPVSHAVASAR